MSHPKLRVKTGCTTCKRRKKKCDEMRPVCGICARLDIVCHYQTGTNTRQGLGSTQALARPPPSVQATWPRLLMHIQGQTIPTQMPESFSPEIRTVMHFYSCHGEKIMGTPETPDEDSLLSLTPLASSTDMTFAALCAVLVLFMPDNWTQKATLSKELEQQSVHSMIASLRAPDEPSEPVVVATGLLHFHDVGQVWLNSSERLALCGKTLMPVALVTPSDTHQF